MKWLESIVAYSAPALLLDGTPWKNEWLEREKRSFIAVHTIWFACAIVGYVGHYFFFDRINGLEPLDFWFAFRMSMAGAMLLALAFYLSPLTSTRYYKVPAVFFIWLMCFTQARVAVWYSLDAWIFSFIFVIGSAFILRLNPVKSFLFAFLTIASTYFSLAEAGLPDSWFGSAAVVTILVVVVIRGANIADVKNFLLVQQNAAAQKQIIELNLEFAHRIRAFIPKVIADRLDALVNEKRMSILEASVDVLRPVTKEVACLFSDIRGFTQGSKDLEAFVSESVLPEVRACSDAVELYSGIPRKIGDLVFAYFDDENRAVNVPRALIAAIRMSQVNTDMNRTSSTREIRRFILVSSGNAVVGNVGGLDSSMEITALGSPVNFLSRLDDATKEPALASHLTSGDVLISPSAKQVLDEINIELQLRRLDLDSLGIEIRDFPETKFVLAMPPSASNQEKLEMFLEQLSKGT